MIGACIRKWLEAHIVLAMWPYIDRGFGEESVTLVCQRSLSVQELRSVSARANTHRVH